MGVYEWLWVNGYVYEYRWVSMVAYACLYAYPSMFMGIAVTRDVYGVRGFHRCTHKTKGKITPIATDKPPYTHIRINTNRHACIPRSLYTFIRGSTCTAIAFYISPPPFPLSSFLPVYPFLHSLPARAPPPSPLRI